MTIVPGTGQRPAATGPGAGARRFGDFVIEREIGRGGMGVVLLALQESMGRRVALKMLPSFAALDPAAVARFQREAEAAGRLSHPGIVPVHGIGEHDGVPFFVMDFIDGPTLGQIVDRLSLRRPELLRASLVEEAQIAERYPGMREAGHGPGNAYVRSCARLCAEVANALAAAHAQRIVHRDLKPNNIMLHPSGRPVVVDFSLARDELNLRITRTGEQIGTPAYMAPEQACGRKRIDARADVWGLGAVLYELLALRPPFQGGGSADTIRRILEEDPVPVRKRNPNVPIDLATIVHKCLAKDPDERYPAVEALELDLRQFLDGRPITVHAPARWARFRAVLQRKRRRLQAAVWALGVAAAIAVAANVLGDRADVRSGYRALERARQALVQDARADAARDLYQRAAALTKRPDEVRAARIRDFRDAFARHYEQRSEVLVQFRAALDPVECAELGDLLQRLEGRGSIGFASRAAEQATRSLAVCRLQDGDLEPSWRACAAGTPLASGEYLVRAASADGAECLLWARVARDQETRIAPRWFGPGELPDGAVPCLEPRTGEWIAIARHEVTRARWREWLASVPEELREELTPLQWDGGASEPDQPVRGLSFHQARVFAALHGAHLPSGRELWLAASAGLQGLVHPWGRRFEPARIAADPFQLQSPEPVHGRPAGASPIGVHHVLGNVAEILSPAGEPLLLAGGGHFLSDDPASLRLLDGGVPTAPLPHALHQDPHAGLRLCWFLPAAGSDDDPVAARRAELRLQSTGSLLQDWTIGADGSVRCRLELNDIHVPTAQNRELVLATPGFVQADCSVTDGHGAPLGCGTDLAPAGESAALDVRLPADTKSGQGYRLVVSAGLVPTSGLYPERDTWVARIPLKRGRGLASLHALQLPPGAVVLEASPIPGQFRGRGRLVLLWEPTQHDQIETAVVRFRMDGFPGRRWPARAAIDAAVAAFLASWNGSGEGLERLLDPAFALLPSGSLRGDVLAQRARRTRLDNVRVTDAVPLGDTVHVDLLADLELGGGAGRSVRLRDWPMSLLLRSGPLPLVLRVMPRGAVDRGRYDENGYEHPVLRVRIEALAGTTLSRTQGELTEMQVKLIPASLPGIHALITGHFAAPATEPDAIRFRLSNGASVLLAGRQLESGDSGVGSEEWEFDLPDGTRSRESWRLLARGRRHLLVRFVASGTDAEAGAALRSAAAKAWCAQLMAALKVE